MFLSLYYDTDFRKNEPAWAILALDFGLFDFNSVTTYVGLL